MQPKFYFKKPQDSKNEKHCKISTFSDKNEKTKKHSNPTTTKENAKKILAFKKKETAKTK